MRNRQKGNSRVFSERVLIARELLWRARKRGFAAKKSYFVACPPFFSDISVVLLVVDCSRTRGGARNFPTGAESSDEGAKIWFSGYHKCQKYPK